MSINWEGGGTHAIACIFSKDEFLLVDNQCMSIKVDAILAQIPSGIGGETRRRQRQRTIARSNTTVLDSTVEEDMKSIDYLFSMASIIKLRFKLNKLPSDTILEIAESGYSSNIENEQSQSSIDAKLHKSSKNALNISNKYKAHKAFGSITVQENAKYTQNLNNAISHLNRATLKSMMVSEARKATPGTHLGGLPQVKNLHSNLQPLPPGALRRVSSVQYLPTFPPPSMAMSSRTSLTRKRKRN